MKTQTEFPIMNAYLGGVCLAGWRMSDGRVRPHSYQEPTLDDWPEEVTLCGHTYTLETVTKHGTNNAGEQFENAEYV